MIDLQQEAAINSIDGVYVVIAGPGAGKTSVLTRRHLVMLANGIPSTDILNLTFTNAAAKEMAGRTELTNAEESFRTFHSFAIDLLKKERHHLSFPVCSTIIPVEMQDYDLLFKLAKRYKISKWRDLQEYISACKRDGISPEQACAESAGQEQSIAAAYDEYEQTCRKEGWLDFDDVMVETVDLLERNADIRMRHQRKYLAVDECQDTDAVQFRLLQLLFRQNIFAVGDENQLIYEWRSAQPGNLTNFARLFPDAKTLYLGTNYRSTPEIVEFLKEILPVDNGLASYLSTPNQPGTRPTIIKYQDADQEAERVLSKIVDPENTVVIARTNRQLFVYQRLCAIRGIKYKILGKKDFFQQNEVKKVLLLSKNEGVLRPANTVLADVIRKNNLIELYRHSGKPMESSPAENLNAIVKMADGKGNIQQFLSYLNKLSRARKSSKGLTLSTAHQMKGKEKDYVFLVGAQEGVLPHKDGNIEEESRIFFVAASRAAKHLEISFSEQPSRFFEQRRQEIQRYVPSI
jgi:DNA helicase II / ATP-dependent DNA helicase PcrA